MKDIEKVLNNFRLTTANIFYHMPDHPFFLQTYVWQDYDKSPEFPELKSFLNFWEHKLDGKLHSVSVESCELINPTEYSSVIHEINLN